MSTTGKVTPATLFSAWKFLVYLSPPSISLEAAKTRIAVQKDAWKQAGAQEKPFRKEDIVVITEQWRRNHGYTVWSSDPRLDNAFGYIRLRQMGEALSVFHETDQNGQRVAQNDFQGRGNLQQATLDIFSRVIAWSCIIYFCACFSKEKAAKNEECFIHDLNGRNREQININLFVSTSYP